MANYFDNPEQALIKKTHFNSVPLSSSEQAVHDWYIRNPEGAKKREDAYMMKDMGAFIREFGGGPYYQAEAEKDKQEVLKLRNKEGNIYKTERAEIFEAIFQKWAKEGKWFGDDCDIVPTLEYDDRVNHTDFVLVFKDSSGRTIRLAVDCSVTEDEDVLRKKVFFTVRGLETKDLTTVKYFSDPNSGKKGKIGIIPRVIAVAEKERMDELSQLFLVAYRDGGKQREKENYFQYYLLKEFESQLETQLEVIERQRAPKGNWRYDKMKKNIKEALNLISEIIQKKESSLDPKVLQRAKKEIADSRMFIALPPLHQKSSQELRY